jgi:hypothetical protein
VSLLILRCFAFATFFGDLNLLIFPNYLMIRRHLNTTARAIAARKKVLPSVISSKPFDQPSDILPSKPRIEITIPKSDHPVVVPFSKSRWALTDKRCGLLAIKKGMMSMWDAWGRMVPITVLQVSFKYG